MPGQKPNIIWLFRILHKDNLEYVLHNGIYTRNHQKHDPNYINIGDGELIAKRNDYPVSITPPNGFLGEYVPFYFGPLSPMLFNIKTGYRGITRRPQADIIYIACQIDDLIEKCDEWCFTDGHAKTRLSTFYNDVADLNEVDWNIVFERYWSNTEDDFDKMRRKQAEFLVKHYVPATCIKRIVVLNQETNTFVQEILDKVGLDIIIRTNPNGKFYY